MNKRYVYFIVFALLYSSVTFAGTHCTGHFVNPITDICWRCLLPLSIGGAKVTGGIAPDTKNPRLPIEFCQMKLGYRVGLNIGYWEPFALADITPTPFCLVNLGGVQVPIGHFGRGGRAAPMRAGHQAFYYVHWYKYPVIYWLQLVMSIGCQQTGEFDIAYLSELDPAWNNDELNFIFNPEAVLFANPVTQMACAADSLAANAHLPLDALFWCAGSQGSLYPMSGTVMDERSPLQTSLLLTERAAFKLHRLGAIPESSPDAGTGKDGPICTEHYSAFLPKSRYRYQLVNPTAAAKACYPFGHTTATWEGGHVSPSDSGDSGYLIWRKRNCTFL